MPWQRFFLWKLVLKTINTQCSSCATLLAKVEEEQPFIWIEGGNIMYGEPDWSSLSLGELFEKADTFAQKAYSSSLSTYAFLQRALEKSPEATGLDQEIVELLEKAQTTYQILAELHTKLDELAQEFLHT